jgi:hypothetical protein
MNTASESIVSTLRSGYGFSQWYEGSCVEFAERCTFDCGIVRGQLKWAFFPVPFCALCGFGSNREPMAASLLFLRFDANLTG